MSRGGGPAISTDQRMLAAPGHSTAGPRQSRAGRARLRIAFNSGRAPAPLLPQEISAPIGPRYDHSTAAFTADLSGQKTHSSARPINLSIYPD